jgi:predicted DNA-binding WGR domain protein
MLKLYRRENGKLQAYHEAWIHGADITEHWGLIGARGETQHHRVDVNLSSEENLRLILAKAVGAGYEPLEADDHAVLIIEYSVQGMGTREDLAKRHTLEDRMNETLGWTGLGHCDGGSIGSGTMEVCCIVANFEIAKKTIEQDLKGTEFDNYSRVYDANAD